MGSQPSLKSHEVRGRGPSAPDEVVRRVAVSREGEVEREVLKTVLDLACLVSSDKKGALFVVAPEEEAHDHYTLHFPPLIGRVSLLEPGVAEVVRRLATLDGAIFLTPQGIVYAYGARVKTQSTLTGFGTRHSSAKGITEAIPSSTAILVSEENGWIKVFQRGKIIVETDGRAVPQKFATRLAGFLKDHDLTFLTAAGVSAAGLATLGAGGLVSILVIGGSYVIVRTAFSTLSGFLRSSDGT